MKLKKIGGVEEAILKHKVKAKEKNHITNKKPILDIMCQDRIPSFRYETKKTINKPLKNTKLQFALNLHKLGRVTVVYT